MIVTVINRIGNSQFTRTGDYETLEDLINDVEGTDDANVFTPNSKFVNKTDNFRNIYKSDFVEATRTWTDDELGQLFNITGAGIRHIIKTAYKKLLKLVASN